MTSPAVSVEPGAHSPTTRLTRVLVYGIVALISATLMTYAVTRSFVWDEGFHLVAAQQILRGKMPYLDFCFPQTPLNAYWNAAWMRVFGEDWRVPHIPAVLEIAAAMFLAAQWILSRFPVPHWRVPAAIVAVCFIGLHGEVLQFAPIAQAYAIGMLLVIAAFRVAVAWPERPRSAVLAFGSGLLAGAAAGTTLLTAPAAVVLLIWFWLRSSALSQRLRHIAAFVVGVLCPFIPVFWLFAKAPRVVFFNIVQYQALFRRANWPGATTHDIDVLSAWLTDGQTLFLGLLVVCAINFLLRKSPWPSLTRSHLFLAAWIAGALVLCIATAHPTFARYFLVAIPMLSILAAVGLYAIGSRMTDTGSPLWPTAVMVCLLVLGFGRRLFEDRDSTTWQEYGQIASKVKQVTPKNGVIYADEVVYFLLKQSPPPGMEFSYSHSVQLPQSEEKLYHIVSQKELDGQVQAGRFDTVQTCKDDLIDEMHLDQVFAHKADVRDCSIYWGKRPSGRAAPKK
jgi:hypothetical protein